MTLFFTMLPLYLLGNLHCIGMCGPLVSLIGQHRYRYFYFLGRLISFTLAGMIAGEVGAVLNLLFSQYHIPAITSLLFGFLLLLIGMYNVQGWQYPGHEWLFKRLASMNQKLSILMLKDQPLPTFLFGFFTLILPCGQTLIVFSACALSGDMWVGLCNGLAFALLTSPSLFIAMHAYRLLVRLKSYYHATLGLFAMLIGFLSICRGLAEMQWIRHMAIHFDALPQLHLVLF